MYESHWQLDRKPFENYSDPDVYFPGESHQAALLKLRYAVENQRGAALLSGPSGSGKTFAIEMLRSALPDEFSPFIHLVYPQMPADQLLAFLAAELGVAREGTCVSVQQSVRAIQQYLHENTERGHHAVFALDEAHLVTDAESLEALRLLLNFQWQGRSGLTLLLVGQPSILPYLDRTPQLEERLGVKCLLRPYTLAETKAYVEHRLKQAGARRAIFDPDAFETLHRLTHGIARRINRLCDLALLIGYAEQRQTLHAEELESINQELVTVAPE